MFVTLFRHAERENSGSENPRLTARGFRQAQSLAQLILEKKLMPPQRLLVSPKIRTQMTFAPISKNLGLELEIFSELNERQNSESAGQFQDRVARGLNLHIHGQSSVFICSHLDWIEEALLKIPSDVDLLQPQFQVWAPGQFAHFEIHHGLWQFKKTGGLLT